MEHGRARVTAKAGEWGGLALLVAVAALAVRSTPARAHSGGEPTRPSFVRPAPPAEIAEGDGGLRWSFAPDVADASYRIAWEDGGSDPTGRLDLYYLDRSLPDVATVDDVERLGRPVRSTGGRIAQLWVSCRCDEDAGVTCPPLGAGDDNDGGLRWCDDAVEWDTRAVPEGTYFIAAVNHDPPFHVWEMSRAPVRIAHGGALPGPAVVVLRPGTFASAVERYPVALVVAGRAPLALDLSWARADRAALDEPGTPIVTGLDPVPGPDGAVVYSWNVGGLGDGRYVLRAALRDASGRVARAESRGGLTVLHLGGDDAAVDLAMSPPDAFAPPPAAPSGCGCALGGRAPSGAASGGVAALLVALGALGAFGARRSARKDLELSVCPSACEIHPDQKRR